MSSRLDYQTLEALSEARLAMEGLRDLLEACACSPNEASDTALYALLTLADGAVTKIEAAERMGRQEGRAVR